MIGLPIVILTIGIVFIVSMTGFVLGIISLRKINRSNGELIGKGFSVISIILGGIGFTLFPLWILTATIWSMILHSLGKI